MNFNDILKKSVLENYQSDLTLESIETTLAIATLLGLFIYLIYRLNTRNGFYNRNFNKSLAILPVITSAIMLAMSSNLAISLGMVGALSIVRFRNAVKEPIDLTYLFWSISIGIITGSGLIELALLLSVAIALLVSLLDIIPAIRAPYLLIITGESAGIESDIITYVKKYAKSVKIRSRNISSKKVEWIFELQIRNEIELIQKITEIESVSSVHMLTHDGDVRF